VQLQSHLCQLNAGQLGGALKISRGMSRVPSKHVRDLSYRSQFHFTRFEFIAIAQPARYNNNRT
jgi:hypothetical protein